MKDLIIKHFRAMMEPYGNGEGLDRDDDYTFRGMMKSIEAMANALHELNPSFDKEQFFKDCGHEWHLDRGYIQTPEDYKP